MFRIIDDERSTVGGGSTSIVALGRHWQVFLLPGVQRNQIDSPNVDVAQLFKRYTFAGRTLRKGSTDQVELDVERQTVNDPPTRSNRSAAHFPLMAVRPCGHTGCCSLHLIRSVMSINVTGQKRQV